MWQNQFSSSFSGIVHALVIEAPAALGAVQRGARRHLGAVADGLHFERAHQLVRVARDHALPRMSSRDLGEARMAELHLARDLRRLQIVVHQAAQLVFDLVRRNAVLALVGARRARARCATSAASKPAKSRFVGDTPPRRSPATEP